jgi:hypothetical protein
MHPAKIAVNYATQNLLLYAQIGSAITTATHAQNLVLFFVRNDPAITMANHANSKLQLIVECLFLLRNEDNSELQLIVETPSLLLLHNFKHPAITAVMNGSFSFKFIVESILEGARFAPNFDRPSNLDSSRLIVDFIPTTSKPFLPPVLNGAIAPTHQSNLHVESKSKLIVICFKIFLSSAKIAEDFVREKEVNPASTASSSQWPH